MGIKYKLKLKDLKIEYLIDYFKPLLRFFKPKEKINNYEELRNFIQKKSAWISQVTLYGYLKTRMGAKYVLMFEETSSHGLTLNPRLCSRAPQNNNPTIQSGQSTVCWPSTA